MHDITKEALVDSDKTETYEGELKTIAQFAQLMYSISRSIMVKENNSPIK